MRAKDAVGRYGEDVVARRLLGRGWEVLDRNWRCQHGELDLVARDPAGALAFIEVKTRRSDAFGHPVEAITRQKLARLRRLGGVWLETHPGIGALPVRIDVVAVLLPRSGPAQIEHLVGVD